METRIRLAVNLWELAEEFNRENYIDEAHELKVIFVDYVQQQNDEDRLEIEEYLKSIGG